ncbi:hypothetical protein LSAT2_007109 [Lamellibrachia satsuma]|nr:hypothetical protein LSAT2_007109 [Lamellibrachia satsuma]
MSADNQVRDPLLGDGVAHIENSTSPTDPDTKYKYYTLPSLRYTSVVRTIIFIDVVFSLALWISGGNTKYFVDNILRFHFLESTFDLALLGAVKVVPLFVLYTSLEDAAFKEIDHPFDTRNIRTKRILHYVISLLSLVAFSYTVVKGALILHAILGDPDYTRMRLTYNILAVSAVVFSLLELLLSFFSYRYMRQLKVYRVQHWLNDSGQEVDIGGTPVRQKVNLGRLILLIKPESGILSIGVLGLLVSTGAQAAQPLFFGKVLDAATHSMVWSNPCEILDMPLSEILGMPLSEILDMPLGEILDMPLSEILDMPLSEILDMPLGEILDMPLSEIIGMPLSEILGMPLSEILDVPPSEILDVPPSEMLDMPLSEIIGLPLS